MRSFNVSSPFRMTHALNGLNVGPALRRNVVSGSCTSARLPSTAPPSTRPCPSRYLVAEWITMSAPSATGRCNAGVQKQLSTASRAPMRRESALSAVTSTISVSGLEGVSRNSSLRVRPHVAFPLGHIGGRYERGLDAEARQPIVEQLNGGTEQARARPRCGPRCGRSTSRTPESPTCLRRWQRSIRPLPAPRAAPAACPRWGWYSASTPARPPRRRSGPRPVLRFRTRSWRSETDASECSLN